MHPLLRRRDALAALAALGANAAAGAASMRTASVDETRQRPARQPLPPREAYAASLLSYDSGNLRLRALVAVPARTAPLGGFPLLVACHGFHPDPPRYGSRASGENLRPGDYYRDVPLWYTAAGFVVVMPDYRGHNDSGGFADARDPTAPLRYADDVLALLGALGAIDEADAGRAFLWGHSMGAEVALRVLAALAGAPRAVPNPRAPRILGASLWSAAGRPPELGRLDAPVLLQHALADPVAPSALSSALAARLEPIGQLRGIELLPGDAHFFQGDQAARAVRRDLEFFGKRMAMETST